MTRRQALILGAVGAGSLVTGAVGLSQTGLPWDQRTGPGGGPIPSGGGADLREPTVLASNDGLLEVELEMGRAEVTLGDRTARMLTYNGTVPGPTLRLRPGDTLRVRLTNNIGEPTNLHVHGLHVSPEGNGDNPFLMIEPGETFDYQFTLPPDHPTGTFWYHPHHHGHVADQIFAGLYGAILVEDGPPADSPADSPAGGERLLLISDVSLTGEGNVRAASIRDRMMGREGEIVLVNGQVRPRIAATAGRTERWRVVNTCVSRHLRLDLAGMGALLLGVDVDRHQPRDPGSLILAPGNRAELLVTADAGTTEFRTLPYDRGGMGMGMMGGGGRTSGSDGGAVVLATVEASEGGPTDDGEPTDSSGRTDGGGRAGRSDGDGAGAASSSALPEQALLRDLRDAEPAARRTISFTMGMGMGAGMSFGFNGQEFDAGRTDQDPAAGTVEEWTILNTTPMDHPFHLHVWPMQVVGANGSAVEEPYWRDVVQVPAGESRTVRIAFDTFTGRTVYHCHILDHEDAGMMGVVEAGG